MPSPLPAAPDAVALFSPIRSVAPPESPFDGVLARGPDDQTVLLVDRGALTEWPGWRREPSEHVLAPIDVLRRADGHDVVLPVLVERLDRLLARRVDAVTAPSAGETVTLVVSVLRGLCGVVEEEVSDTAEWWLSEDGRPVLVEGRGDANARRASELVLCAVADSAGPPLSGIVREVAELVADGRSTRRELEEREDDLFRHAAPEPIATQVIVPSRAAARRAHGPSAAEREPAADPAPAPWWRRLAGHVDAELADALIGAGSRLARGMRSRTGSGARRRRAPLVLAGVLAAVVLAGGLLWPSEDESSGARTATSAPAGAEPQAESASPVERGSADDAGAMPDATAEPRQTEQAASPVPASLEQALGELLDRRRGCSDDACRAEVIEDAGRALAAGAIDLSAHERTIRLIDDLGGLAVLAVEPVGGGTGAQFVTIVDTDGGWRIRDAYVVADPPS